MDQAVAAKFVKDLYRHLLKRDPRGTELQSWTEVAMGQLDPVALFDRFVASDEYRNRDRVMCTFPSGHFHSPVVDPAAVENYHAVSARTTVADLTATIPIDVNAMERFWNENLPFIQKKKFPQRKSEGTRFYYDDAPFPPGDATTLRLMLHALRPSRIIEIGSGFSTACMLDTADEIGLSDLSLICIEPYPSRLRGLLRPADYGRVQIVERGVQGTPLDIYRSLRKNDILFIDSTHVLKTGSDVHYELFSILPVLAPGVVVHFHDCQFPFEYPRQWIFAENYSWNEVYALRAFLMYNEKFKITFWGGLFANRYREKLLREFPDFLSNAGGSIWMTVQ